MTTEPRPEAVAKALYEDSRDPDYSEPEYDWPNIDTGYDKDDEDETDPEWLRNRFRHQARVALDADPARQTLTEIRELHQSYRIEYEPTQDGNSYSWPLCKHCHVRYPCPTVALLDAGEHTG